MPVIKKRKLFYHEDESVSVTFYKRQLSDGHTVYTLAVKVDGKDNFIMDHRCLAILQARLEKILPTALLSRHHRVDTNLNLNL